MNRRRRSYVKRCQPSQKLSQEIDKNRKYNEIEISCVMRQTFTDIYCLFLVANYVFKGDVETYFSVNLNKKFEMFCNDVRVQSSTSKKRSPPLFVNWRRNNDLILPELPKVTNCLYQKK